MLAAGVAHEINNPLAIAMTNNLDVHLRRLWARVTSDARDSSQGRIPLAGMEVVGVASAPPGPSLFGTAEEALVRMP